MKMLLASSGFFVTKYLLEYFDVNELKMAYITVAGYGKVSDGTAVNTQYLKDERERFSDAGIPYTELNDLFQFDENSLRSFLRKFNVVYVTGGNTFYLLKAVRASGFDKVIRDLINGGVFYIGASAGSYITCPTIEVATWKEADVFDRHGITDLTGMNLVPFLVKAHYIDEKRDQIVESIKNTELEVRVLTDTQAILVEDDGITLLGEGPEINFL